MAGGIYSALSGLRARTDHLDRLAADIANAGTSGYKGERSTTSVAERDAFATALASAVDVVAAPPRVDFRGGEIAPTGRDLDLAIEGPGFFEIQTPAGLRYTRNGHFSRSPQGTITTASGDPLLGEKGPITLPPGPLEVADDGTLSVGGTTVGRPRIVTFADLSKLGRDNGVQFRAPGDAAPTPAAGSRVRSGMLEESNVALSERMTQVIEVSRGFEALQRGLSVLFNDMDGRAINELGRR